jgi:hypothetical protein
MVGGFPFSGRKAQTKILGAVMFARLIHVPLLLTALSLSVPASAGAIYSYQGNQFTNFQGACPPECNVSGFFPIAGAPLNLNGSDLFTTGDSGTLTTTPLPSTWTMMLIALAMGFAAYRLFSVPD